jgi:hypothetical protein
MAYSINQLKCNFYNLHVCQLFMNFKQNYDLACHYAHALALSPAHISQQNTNNLIQWINCFITNFIIASIIANYIITQYLFNAFLLIYVSGDNLHVSPSGVSV